MNLGLESYYEQFDACLKAGNGGKSVSLVLNSDSPSSETKLRRLPPNAFTRRVSCSLSGDGSEKTRYLLGYKRSTVWRRVTPSKLPPKTPAITTQRTEASPCAVRTRDGTIVRRMDIGRRNLLGPALAGASVRVGEGQPNFPGQQRRKTSAPCAGVVVFFLSLTSRRLEQSPPFLGGAVLCSLFSFSLLIHVSTWTDLQHILKSHGYSKYNDYLQSEHWRDLRRRKGVYSCSSCSARRTLVVHHVHYRNLLDVGLDDLVVLCQECHDDFHQACRHFNVSYVGIGAVQIADAVADFRKTDWYRKWKAKLQRREVKDKMIPNGFNRKSYAKMLIRKFKFVARNPTREQAEGFCKWLLEKIK